MSLEARRSLAGQTGESTRETSLSPSTFASRACAASEGGRRGLKRRSSSSSHIARRIGLPPAASPSSASSAPRGTGGDDLDRTSTPLNSSHECVCPMQASAYKYKPNINAYYLYNISLSQQYKSYLYLF